MLGRMKMANLAVITFAVTAPLVHVLGLYDQFSMNAKLWFALQALLHCGWDLLLGPVQILTLLTTFALVYLRRLNTKAFQASLLAACFYAAILVVFFIFNMPVNAVFSGDFLDVGTADWETVRRYWGAGHAIVWGLAILGWLALLRASFLDRKRA